MSCFSTFTFQLTGLQSIYFQCIRKAISKVKMYNQSASQSLRCRWKLSHLDDIMRRLREMIQVIQITGKNYP